MPSPEKSYPYLVADRFAKFLAAEGHGVYGDELPEDSEWVLMLGPQAPASDVTVINVTPSNPVMFRADVTLGVQLKWRGTVDADPWGEVADRVQAVTDWAQPHGRPRSSFYLGELGFGRVNVTSSMILGPDAQRRPVATLNLEFHGRRVAGGVPRVTPPAGPNDDGYYEIPGATITADGYAMFGGS